MIKDKKNSLKSIFKNGQSKRKKDKWTKHLLEEETNGNYTTKERTQNSLVFQENVK